MICISKKGKKHKVTEFLMTKNVKDLSCLQVVCDWFKLEQNSDFSRARACDVCPHQTKENNNINRNSPVFMSVTEKCISRKWVDNN